MAKNLKKLIKGVEVTPLKRLNEAQANATLKNPDKYVFQGVFTACSTPEHKIVNRNGRIYQKAEFLRHLGYLRDMIKENNGKLLGELDHPEGRFDVQLKEASHMITDLWFDETTNCVMGRLEVLDTPNGKILKELIDAGFPLYVSSRAAGDVNEKTKEVEIAQIFTYDVVCTPGFKEARLERLDESAMTDRAMHYINEAVSNAKTASLKPIEVPEEFIDERVMENYKNIKVRDLTNPLLEDDENLTVKNFLPVQDMSGKTTSLKEEDDPEEKPEKPEEKPDEKKGGDKEEKSDEIEIKELSDEEKKANRDKIVSIKGLDKDGNDLAADSNDEEKKNKRDDIVSISAGKDEGEDKDKEGDKEKEEKPSETEQNECDSFDKNNKTDEACSKTDKKMKKKTDAMKEKTDKDVADYQALIDSVTKQEAVKESIIRRYPFAAFLTESNFSKFAILRPKQKKRCAEFIEEHDVHSIEAINELWSTPLREEKKRQQNWLRLASQSDIDLYTSAPVEVQNAIEEQAKYVILETQDDVDMFWQRTGLRQHNAQRLMMERKMFDFKNNMFASEEYKQNNQLGYNVDWITITENYFNNN